MNQRAAWLGGGLFLTTFAVLVVEVLDSRLLSVLTWYHLAFLAVSLAMLGLAAGAVTVFTGGLRYEGEQAPRELRRRAFQLAVSIPACHLLNLVVPIPTLDRLAVMEVAAVVVSVVSLAVPFVLAGMVVTLALTRCGGDLGRLYAIDLAGAALGALLVVPLLQAADLSSVLFLAGSLGALGAFCFARLEPEGTGRVPALVLAGVMVIAAGLNASTTGGVGVVWAKNRRLQVGSDVAWSAWNSHSYVVVTPARKGRAYFWGPGHGAERFSATTAMVLIDGEAGTPITLWSGKLEELAWAPWDLTWLPYLLRGGEVGVIGVGGGRDVLSALQAGNTRITGLELNGNLIAALEGEYRNFATLGRLNEVELVHTEARSWLSRTDRRFDVLQMSLIDTWAATGAGAFTLSENGLYTVEGWRVFLSRLTPTGVFSVSRWFSPSQVSETSRLVSLAVAALLDRGVARPREHLLMLTQGTIATLVTSLAPFTETDKERVQAWALERGFTIAISPWTTGSDPWLEGIAAAQSADALEAAVANPTFDFSPPTDARPYFFNTLKPAAFRQAYSAPMEGVIAGNLRATWTLVLLFAVTLMLVVAVIGWPLARVGSPGLPPRQLVAAVVWFGFIGMGYMLVQVPLLQQLTLLLGHPTLTLSVVLSSMILFTGLGSWASAAFPALIERGAVALPLLAATLAVAAGLGLPLVVEGALPLELPARVAVCVALIAPLATVLGFFFPMGVQRLSRISPTATAWMWGLNGAAGVLASVVAVAVSMWLGISVNLFAAAALYAVLPVAHRALAPAAR